MVINSTETGLNIAEKLTRTTTSANSADVDSNFHFSQTNVSFTNIASIDSDTISKETEDKFYKKVFETKSIQ